MLIVRIVLFHAIASACDSAVVDRVVTAGLIKRDFPYRRKVWVVGLAEPVRVAASQAVGAVVALIEANHVFRPKPHGCVRCKVVSDCD